jgi:ABC-type phosphate/phosphonate transport system substrate-binding protein
MFANARMYSINAAVAAAWRELLAWVVARAGEPIDVIDYPAPQPLAALWSRADMACALMCGYPWVTWHGAAARPIPLAAPLPSGPRYEGRAVYCTDIVVRSDAPFDSIEDLIGKRLAWTVTDSQSGYQALRTLFAARANGRRLFGATVGPLITPRRVIEALLAGEADAGPIDSYWHDLLRRHEPELAARIRTLAMTPMTPMPFFAAAPGVPETTRARLIDALLAVGAAGELRSLRADLLIDGFMRVDPDAYRAVASHAARADTLGYLRLE